MSQGDRLVARGELARAHAVYQKGLEQGVDAEQARAHIETQLSKVRASLRQQAIDEAMTQLEQGDPARALEIFESGAWGDEALMARSTQILQQRLAAHIRQQESMDEGIFERVLGYEVMREAGEPVAREALTQKFDAFARATGSPASRAKALAGLVTHPAWRVDGVEAVSRSTLLELGDEFVRGLDPLNSDRDFGAALMIHEAQGFGHSPWYEANLARLSSAVESRRAQIKEIAATQGELPALEALAALHKKFPMTEEQSRKNQALFDSLMASHAAPLLAQAREKKALGQPAQAHVYAALARYYGASLPSDLSLSRNEAKFVGKVPDVVQVIVELEYDYNGNCQEPARDEGPVVIGPDSAAKKERAIVTTYFSCTQTVTYTESTTVEEGFEYDKNETTVSQYDYCRGNSLTDRQFTECNRALDDMSTTERDERLTSSNPEFRKVYNEKVTRTRNVDNQSTWHAFVSFRGKTYRVGEGATGDGQVTSSPQNARFLAVNGLYKQVEQENEAQIARARSATTAKLDAARDAGDLDSQLAALMRMAWLPSTKHIELDQLSEEDAKLFALGGERVEVATAALEDKRLTLPEVATSVPVDTSLTFEPVLAQKPLPQGAAFEVVHEGAEVSIPSWRSTGLEQHIDYGVLSKAPGSSLFELGVGVARVPLVDAPLATSIEPKITLKHTSLGGAMYLDPPGISGSRGFSVGLRRALVRAGGFNDPKLTSYLGLSYTQVARGLEPDVRRPADEEDDTRTAQPREQLVALYRQGAGYRFLGAEVGTNIPMGLTLGAEVGAHLNMLSVVDLFDDAASGEYSPMSQGYLGLTWSPGAWFVHARGSYWFGSPAQTSPVGGLLKVGVRL